MQSLLIIVSRIKGFCLSEAVKLISMPNTCMRYRSSSAYYVSTCIGRSQRQLGSFV